MTPSKFALLRPHLSIDDEPLDSNPVTNGHDENSKARTPTSPNISMKSRKSRKAELADSIDLDVYRLVSHLAVVGSTKKRMGSFQISESISAKPRVDTRSCSGPLIFLFLYSARYHLEQKLLASPRVGSGLRCGTWRK